MVISRDYEGDVWVMNVEVTDIRRDKEVIRLYSGDEVVETATSFIYTVWYKVTINGTELEGEEEFELGQVDLSFEVAEELVRNKLSKEGN